jgi:glyceraldehyde-3-phosphate dehydrogenase/erythrose-4-phosphate dehydrogenase
LEELEGLYLENLSRDNVEVVAINDFRCRHLALLIKIRFSSRTFAGKVEVLDGKLLNDKNIRITAEKDPVNLK